MILLPSGCGLPRVVVLNDPLTAAEHNDLGYAYERQGLFDLAAREYTKAAEADKNWAIPRFNLGNLAYQRGDLKGAERHFRAALRCDAHNTDVMNNLATVLADQGRGPEAADMIARALAIARKPAYLDTYRRIMQP
ncbi:MAG TPA: tetratricopeptide repeat protein [Deltaproteobacteria bacterium]|nr:tetratricopeptide repeat protein [Deltaproteobacteria bacterium]